MENFPAICIENFYKNPDKVREFALRQEYHQTDGSWPGKRTVDLHHVDKEFFDDFCTKLFSVFYDFNTSKVEWNVSTCFQLVDNLSQDQNSSKNTGWIHHDDNCVAAGVIYLTPNIDPNCGTSIFSTDPSYKWEWADNDSKNAFYRDGIDLNGTYEETIQKHNCHFKETARFFNVYNNLIAFDGTTAHGVNSYYTTNEPRLTQVFFIRKLESNSPPPLKRYDLNR